MSPHPEEPGVARRAATGVSKDEEMASSLVIASEAKQSRAARQDWIASSLRSSQ